MGSETFGLQIYEIYTEITGETSCARNDVVVMVDHRSEGSENWQALAKI